MPHRRGKPTFAEIVATSHSTDMYSSTKVTHPHTSENKSATRSTMQSHSMSTQTHGSLAVADHDETVTLLKTLIHLLQQIVASPEQTPDIQNVSHQLLELTQIKAYTNTSNSPDNNE